MSSSDATMRTNGTEERLAVVGLGYVGLPLALGFARHFSDVAGFDISEARVTELNAGTDRTGEVGSDELRASTARFTSDPGCLADRTFVAVTVPTPIDARRQPDLSALRAACELVGRGLGPGTVVVFESTVYPGLTEEVCGPWLEEMSGLKAGKDFFLGYSPERINPGDREHTLETIVKVVAGQDAKTLERVAAAYERVVPAGVHRTPSIRVAEAAKVIENTQRDLNIALMNELALIFDRLEIPTADVLAAARTKWNFLPFTPGLVGGHCIGVDPYYLTARAEEVGYHPQVILAGRRVNDNMGAFVAGKLVKMLAASGRPVASARVGVLGVTFKENVSDTRNTRVVDIIDELRSFGIDPLVHDPHAEADQIRHEHGLELSDLEAMQNLDGLILAVAHRDYLQVGTRQLCERVRRDGALVDVRSALTREELRPDLSYWAL